MMNESEILSLTGIHCGNCVATVERALLGVAGVSSASMNLATKRVKVHFDSSQVSIPDLVGAVEQAGYGAEKLR